MSIYSQSVLRIPPQSTQSAWGRGTYGIQTSKIRHLSRFQTGYSKILLGDRNSGSSGPTGDAMSRTASRKATRLPVL